MEWQAPGRKNRFSEAASTGAAGRAAVRHAARGAAGGRRAFGGRLRRVLRERPSLVDHLLAGPAWDDDLVDAVNAPGKGAEPAAGRVMFLLDTNIISEARRRPPAAVDWLSRPIRRKLYLSVITLGEIARGVAMKEREDRPAAGHLPAGSRRCGGTSLTAFFRSTDAGRARMGAHRRRCGPAAMPMG